MSNKAKKKPGTKKATGSPSIGMRSHETGNMPVLIQVNPDGTVVQVPQYNA